MLHDLSHALMMEKKYNHCVGTRCFQSSIAFFEAGEPPYNCKGVINFHFPNILDDFSLSPTFNIPHLGMPSLNYRSGSFPASNICICRLLPSMCAADAHSAPSQSVPFVSWVRSLGLSRNPQWPFPPPQHTIP